MSQSERVLNNVGYAVSAEQDGEDWTAVSDQPPADVVWDPATWLAALLIPRDQAEALATAHLRRYV